MKTARGQEAAGDGADRRSPTDTLRDELKASRKDLERFFELSLDMLCVAGTDGYFKTVNPSFSRVLGYAREELLSRPFLDFVHPDDREATVKEINKLSSGRPTFRFENRYRRKDGSYRWFEWMSMPVPEEDTIYAIARDITEHKTMDRRLRTIVESAPVAMILVDPQDRIQLANRKLLEISGYEADELIGRPAEVLIPRSFRAEYALARRKLLAAEESLRFGAGGNLIALRKGGVEFPVEIVLSSVDLGGPHLLCAVTDITERKKAMERVRKIVEFSPDGILLVDAAGSIRLVNGAAERMFGASRKELLGRPLECLLPERFRHGHSHHRDTFLTEGRERPMGGSSRELHGLSGSGKEFPVDVALKPLEIDGEKFIISTIRDLTDRKKVEREVLVAREIQQALLPTALPSIPGLDIAAHERSAEPTCGDFFDFVAGSGGSSVIAVGDVSGHGFGPAILMASVMSYLRAFARGEMALDRILARTNDLLCEETRPEDFVTALVVRVDPKNRVLEYGNSGHPAGWVLDAQGAVKYELRGTGMPLGMFAGAEYRSVSSLLLRPGDTVVLYTDGISEAESPDGSQFGDGRILEAVREHLGENARRITESLFSAVRDFTHGGRPTDDMTAVIIKVGDEQQLPPVT